MAAAGTAAEDDGKAFKARATLSYQGTGGNTQNHGGAAAGKVEYTRGRLILDGNGDYTMSSKDGEKSGESMGAGAGVKYFLTAAERLYGRYKGEWRRNVFAGFAHRVSSFAGVGVYLIRTEPQELSVEAGPSYINEWYPDAGEEDPASFAAAHAGIDYRLLPTDGTEVNAGVVWDMNLKDTEDQLLAADATLRISLANWLAFTASEKVAWDNTPSEGFEELDLTTTVGLTLQNY
jgi:putative salt-induced outer membrane protein YdiY